MLCWQIRYYSMYCLLSLMQQWGRCPAGLWLYMELWTLAKFLHVRTLSIDNKALLLLIKQSRPTSLSTHRYWGIYSEMHQFVVDKLEKVDITNLTFKKKSSFLNIGYNSKWRHALLTSLFDITMVKYIGNESHNSFNFLYQGKITIQNWDAYFFEKLHTGKPQCECLISWRWRDVMCKDTVTE